MFKIKVSSAQEMFNHHYLVPNGIGDNKSTDLIWLDKSRPRHPCMATLPYSLAGEGGECTHVTETVTIKPRVVMGLTFESVVESLAEGQNRLLRLRSRLLNRRRMPIGQITLRNANQLVANVSTRPTRIRRGSKARTLRLERPSNRLIPKKTT